MSTLARAPVEHQPERTVFEIASDAPTVVVTAVGAAEGARGAAAALTCAAAGPDRAPLFVDLGGRLPRPTLLASTAARELEDRLVAHLPRTRVAARGQVCHLAAPADEEGFAAAAAAVAVARGALAVFHVAPAVLQPLLAAAETGQGPRCTGALLRADVATDRALLSLVVCDLRHRGFAIGVLKHRLGWVDERRALFGVLGSESGGIPPRLRARVLGSACHLADKKFRGGSDERAGGGSW